MSLIPLQVKLAIVGALVLALGVFSVAFVKRGKRIEDLAGKLAVSKQAALDCSNGVERMRAAEDSIQALLRAEQRKVEEVAKTHEVLAKSILTKSPVQPTITAANELEFGPAKTEDKLKDYTATHKLINDYLDAATK